jgi:hypothetical protein
MGFLGRTNDAQQEKLTDTQLVADVFGPACYIASSLPVVLYLAYKYSADDYAHDAPTAFRRALLANTNAGGENCHRGSALVALMGAAVGVDNIDKELLTGLAAYPQLREELELFCAQNTSTIR